MLDAFAADGAGVRRLRVDGGMAANDWLMQFIADIADVPVERPDYMEMTALGAAALAAIKIGWTDEDAWASRARESTLFTPNMSDELRDALWAGWQGAVASALTG